MGCPPYIGVPRPGLRALVVYPTHLEWLRCAYPFRGDEREMTTAFIQGIGPLELGIVLLIVLVLVGRSRLPQLGRQLGDGMREFKDSVTKRADKHFDGESDTDAPAALGEPHDRRGRGAGRGRRGRARALVARPHHPAPQQHDASHPAQAPRAR